ncbi:MAG: extracellular solute-binding protein [Tessaracoccus sp.]|uniref:extracellular solute-binding protein n=1 Tax=Tessaracoccus sp. TaxID=1971211 RepID=UPI001ED78892|nr:extracellular solute-binding protein [Tessaracoccus sp.]MBK7819744.1 extracellular solute-binding protein [Tessaracoccus sp.]
MSEPLQKLLISRRQALGLSAAIGAGALAACGGNPAENGGPTSTGDAAKSVEFTSWIFGSDTAGPKLRAIGETFTSQTGIQVKDSAYPYLQYLDQVVLKARSGSISGIAHIDEEWMSTLITAGALKEIPSSVSMDPYPENVASTGLFQGTRYGVPWTHSALGLVANSELLAAAGVTEHPTTIDGFTDMLRALKRTDSSLVPYCPATSVQQLKDMVPWMWAFGSPIVQDATVTLGDEGSLAAVDYWKMLLDEGLIQAGMVRDDMRTLFAQGKVAIYDDAPQAIGIIPGQSSDPDIAGKMVPFTRPGKEGPGDTLLWSQPLVAFETGAAELKLMQFLSTDDGALRAAFEMNGQPPATVEGTQADWFTSNEFYKVWNERVTPRSRRNPFWDFPSASAAQTVFNEQVEAALAGSGGAAAALAAAADELQGMLKK